MCTGVKFYVFMFQVRSGVWAIISTGRKDNLHRKFQYSPANPSYNGGHNILRQQIFLPPQMQWGVIVSDKNDV